MGRVTFPLKRRIDDNVSKEPTSGCWLWTGYEKTTNRGLIIPLLATMRHGLRDILNAKRVSYREYNGPIGRFEKIVNSCGNQHCVNPNHLKKHVPKKSEWRQTSEYTRKYQLAAKVRTFNAYGGCHCAACGEIDIECLSLDHINRDGAKHREETGCGTGNALYSWLHARGYPAGFRVLCMSCQWRARTGTLPIERSILMDLLGRRAA